MTGGGDIVLACRDLAVGYDAPVLAHVDLAIERGEVVALLGGSGCGKSTLLRTLVGLLPPLAGTVEVFGRPLYELPLDERNRLLARTGTAFQQDALFGSMTLEDNIALPLCELTRVPAPVVAEMVRMRLALVGLAGLEHRLPGELSGGQRKRAALARASILDPELMFCDEPSAGLDPAVAAGIDETLLQFRAVLGITLAVVSHELESIRTIADRAVLFADGGIRAAGTIDELSRSRDPEVFGFFHRVAERPRGPASIAT
ncbi:MAG: ATP-binding cassette domain-containing protein [Deltaproteobacteria bacterium]|nr:MAG: ATP-binding cassette domain-containing protein [Deltaproteobacteria bacterium]